MPLFANFLPIFFLAVLGSFINIPLGKRKIVVVERPYFFGLFKKSYAALQGISINVGGAVIPALLAFYLFFRVPLGPALFAVLCMALVSKFLSKIVPGRGVVISPFLLAGIAVIAALIIAPGYVALVAFISGVLGTLIGADLLNIPKILRQGESGILSIGGEGVFDGIFLIGVISALLVLA